MKKFSLWQSRSVRTVLSVGVISGLVFACNNDALSPDVNQPSSKNELVESVEGNQFDLAARTLAKTLADPEMRSFVKNEAAKKFDGDYSILYSNVAERMVGSKTIKQTMNAAIPKQSNARPMSFDQLAKDLPLLNISVPVHLDKWNTDTYEPLVVVLPDAKTEKSMKQYKAYDKLGNIHWLDATKAPTFPVVVVGKSERIEISDNGIAVFKKGLFELGENKDRLKVNLMDPGEGGGGGGGGSFPGTYCSDATKLNLYLSGWYTGNLSAIESWARGTPEIRMRAFGITQSQTKIDVYGDPTRGNLWEPNSRSDIDGTWWNLNDYLFYWNVSSYGEEVTFILHEEDGGNPKDISIPISYKGGGFETSTTITFRVDDGDDYVGYFPRRIPFCNGSEIGNETLKFKVYRN